MPIRKDKPFIWAQVHKAAFDTLKHAFISAPVLHHFDSKVEIISECYTSGHVCAGVLS